MHSCPMADFKHHNVDLDFRDALRDAAAGCASDVLAGVLGKDLKEARGEAEEELIDEVLLLR